MHIHQQDRAVSTHHRPGTRVGPLLRAALSVLLAVAVSGVLIVAGPAAVSAHGPDANGCTGVPDSGFGFEFHAGCDAHDRCYRTQPYGSGSAGRKQCDRTFRSELLGYCDRHGRLSLERVVCRSTARAYYYGVRLFGFPFWEQKLPTVIA